MNSNKFTRQIAAPAAALALLPALLLGPACPAASRAEAMQLETRYLGEVFSKLHGGLSPGGATESRGYLETAAELDLSRLAPAPGGRLRISFQAARGRGISEAHVGDVQTLSNLDAAPHSRVGEVWWERSLAGELLRVKLGRQDANADFCALEAAGPFLNSSFGLVPGVPIPTFPEPDLGLALFLEPRGAWSLGLGRWTAPNGDDPSRPGAILGGAGNAVTAGELAWRPGGGGGATGRAVLRLGIWRHDGDHPEHTPDGPGRSYAANRGLYLIGEATILRRGDAARGERILDLFLQLAESPDSRNELARHRGAGLLARGWLPGRERDAFGLGVARACFCRALRIAEGRGAETTWEGFYRLALGERLILQPDLQYVRRPGGAGRDALALGLRCELRY